MFTAISDMSVGRKAIQVVLCVNFPFSSFLASWLEADFTKPGGKKSNSCYIPLSLTVSRTWPEFLLFRLRAKKKA